MDVSLPDQLGAVGRESSAAAPAVVRKLNLSAPPEKITGQQDVAFVPVTRAQWKSVLRDADLPGLQQETDEIAAEILRLRTASGRAVGKQLPELLRCLRASVVAMSAAAEEVSWFRPSRTSAAERRLATDLARANRSEVHALFACLEQGWAESAWSAVRRYALAAQAAGRALEAAAWSDHARPYRRGHLPSNARGISRTAASRLGGGVTGPSSCRVGGSPRCARSSAASKHETSD